MIYVTRHGRSMTNDSHDIGCPFPVTVRNNVLTEEGVLQALEYADWLREEGADVRNIVCSPYARTKQTAYSIATRLKTLVPIHYDRGLREIEWKINGRWHRDLEKDPNFDAVNMPINERPLVDRRRRAYTLESPLNVYQRTIPAFAKIVKRYHKRGELLLVSHYFPVRSISAFIEHGDPGRMLDYDPRNLHRAAWPVDLVIERLKEDGLWVKS